MYCIYTCILYFSNKFVGFQISLYFIFHLDLMSASKDKSLQAVDMNTGGISHVIKKAHE